MYFLRVSRKNMDREYVCRILWSPDNDRRKQRKRKRYKTDGSFAPQWGEAITLALFVPHSTKTCLPDKTLTTSKYLRIK
jgi:hypothetical protein